VTHPHVKGSLARMEREDAAGVRRQRFTAAVDRAVAAGFSERQAPFAAMAALMRPGITVARLREHLETSRPELFEETA